MYRNGHYIVKNKKEGNYAIAQKDSPNHMGCPDKDYCWQADDMEDWDEEAFFLEYYEILQRLEIKIRFFKDPQFRKL